MIEKIDLTSMIKPRQGQEVRLADKINEIIEHLNLLDKLIIDHADYHQREHLE